MSPQTVNGIAASSGVAIGRAFVLPAWEWDIPEKDIDVTQLANEFDRLYQGIRESKNELEVIKREMTHVIGQENSLIFDAHLAILDDPEFMNEVQGIIQRQYKVAEVAVKEVIDQFASMFDLIDDEYMKERRVDVKDVGNRLLQHLIGAPDITLPTNNDPFILVAKELSPSQLANLNPERVLGIVTLTGGRNSHAAIMARSMGIPFVISLEDQIMSPIQTGEELIVDGDNGVVYIQPELELLTRYKERQQSLLETRRQLQENRFAPSVMRDGTPITISANISSLKELEIALENGAEGVGLFRTEFLYMDRSSFPDEEAQLEIYRSVVERLNDKSIVFRTLDIGGDKLLDYYQFPEEDNPFLGYRAIRFSLDRQDIFKTQIRAILRASTYGNVKIMFPMITAIEQWRQASEILEQAKEELRAEELSFNEQIEVGVMIEVPAAVMIADFLAEEVDFFSIGTNDLIQYVLAVDRMNDHIADLYDPFHPAVIRMLKLTIEAANRHHIPFSVCGEMAGDPYAIPLLIGLGVHQLSMSVRGVLEIKGQLLKLDASMCETFAQQMMECRTGTEAEELALDLMKRLKELTGS
jgi:phosphotransferase system enzyme I (PtsI)